MTNKEAIEILKNYHNGYFVYKIDDVHEAHNLAIKALAERPQGEWIFDNEHSLTLDTYRCSNCGILSCVKFYKFCPDCGAFMKEGE